MTSINRAQISRIYLDGQASAPTGTPAAGYYNLYVGDDGKLYLQSSSSSVAVGGGLNLLDSKTASSSASLSFTGVFTSTYDEYIVEFVNILPATDSVSLGMRVSTDGGSTYDSGANYGYADLGWRIGGSGVSGAESGQNQIYLDYTALAVKNTSTYGGINGQLRLYNPLSSVWKRVIGSINYMAGDSTNLGSHFTGEYQSTTPVNAIQFFFSSGNIASGSIYIYGVRKS